MNSRHLARVDIRQLITPLILAGTTAGAVAQHASPVQSAALLIPEHQGGSGRSGPRPADHPPSPGSN